MTNALDAFESFEFLPDANLLFLAAAAVEAAVDDFDRLHDAAGSAGPPDFTEAALAKAVQKLVAGDRLCRAFHSNHVRPRSTCKKRRATRSVQTGGKLRTMCRGLPAENHHPAGLASTRQRLCAPAS